MMEAEALVAELGRLDVVLSVREGKLVCNAPPGALTHALRERLVRLKPQLVTLLAARQGEVRVPLSNAQARIHAIATLLPHAGAAGNVPLAFRLEGALEVDALARALRAVVARHEAFRTRCGPGPCAIVQHQASLALPLHDLRDAGPDAVSRHVDALVGEPLPLDVAPILRAALLRTHADAWVLVLVTHVLVFDGRSTPILLDELAAGYAAALAGDDLAEAPPAPRYSEVARAPAHALAASQLAHRRERWCAALVGTTTIAALDDASAPEHARHERRCGHVPVRLPAPLGHAVKALAPRLGATLFHTLLAAFAVLLQRHTGRASLAVGTIVSDRRDLAAERTIGSFARETLLRADFGPKTTFRDVVLALRDRCREAMASLELPFEAILPALPPALRLRPPFRVMFVLHQRGANEPDAPPLPGLRVERLPVAEPRSHYLLDLVLHDTPAGIAGELIHGEPAVPRAQAELLVARYLSVLEPACADPDAPLASWPDPRPSSHEPALAPVDERAGTPPIGAVEATIARRWATLLERPRVGRDQDFFDLGGHSLLALAMLHELAAELGPLAPDALARFAHAPTVATLAQLVPARSITQE